MAAVRSAWSNRSRSITKPRPPGRRKKSSISVASCPSGGGCRGRTRHRGSCRRRVMPSASNTRQAAGAIISSRSRGASGIDQHDAPATQCEQPRDGRSGRAGAGDENIGGALSCIGHLRSRPAGSAARRSGGTTSGCSARGLKRAQRQRRRQRRDLPPPRPDRAWRRGAVLAAALLDPRVGRQMRRRILRPAGPCRAPTMLDHVRDALVVVARAHRAASRPAA